MRQMENMFFIPWWAQRSTHGFLSSVWVPVRALDRFASLSCGANKKIWRLNPWDTSLLVSLKYFGKVWKGWALRHDLSQIFWKRDLPQFSRAQKMPGKVAIGAFGSVWTKCRCPLVFLRWHFKMPILLRLAHVCILQLSLSWTLLYLSGPGLFGRRLTRHWSVLAVSTFLHGEVDLCRSAPTSATPLSEITLYKSNPYECEAPKFHG